jgi:hypothetical protein
MMPEAWRIGEKPKMPLTYIAGDPTLTRAHALAFGYNATGRTEVGDLEMLLLTRYPAAFAAYGKLCRRGRITAGRYWMWRESTPRLVFLVVRETIVGATRLRFVQAAAAQALSCDYSLEGIESLAIAPLGRSGEMADIKSTPGDVVCPQPAARRGP